MITKFKWVIEKTLDKKGAVAQWENAQKG